MTIIINAIYLFITGWLRSFGFSETAIGEDVEITFNDLKYLLLGLWIAILEAIMSILRGFFAPWISSYWFFESENAPEHPGEAEATVLWYFFRNSESATFPFFYYIAAVISWYYSGIYIVSLIAIIMLLGVLVIIGGSS